MSSKNDYNKQWAIWAFDFYTTAWDDFQEDNSENISLATIKIHLTFMEHLKEKLTRGLPLPLLTDEMMSTQVFGNTAANLATNAPQMCRLELTDISAIPIIPGRPTDRCNICGESFTGLMSLQRHMKSHEGKRLIVASTPLRPAGRTERSKSPEQLLAQASGLAIIEEETSNSSVSSAGNSPLSGKQPTTKGWECQECGKKFKNSVLLSLHTRVLHQKKNQMKSKKHSTKTAKTGGQLASQDFMKSRQKINECSDCGKKFASTGSLTVHRRIHSGERPYKCDVCQRAFSFLGNLTRHRRIHLGERPYKCDVCQRAFSQLSNLRKHQQLHSKRKLLKCDICEKMFKSKFGLVGHQKKQHPIG